VQSKRHSAFSSLDALWGCFSQPTSGLARFAESQATAQALSVAFANLKRKAEGEAEVDPFAPPADQGSVRQDLRSILSPQKFMLAASAIPACVLPNDLPSTITKSSGNSSGAGQGKELERLKELARNQLALVSLLDSLQSLLFSVLFDTSDETTLEFRDSIPAEVTTVLSFLGSIFGHLTSSSARLYSRLVLTCRDSFIGSMRTDLASALRSAPLSTSGFVWTSGGSGSGQDRSR
jgi:hypothetical protein